MDGKFQKVIISPQKLLSSIQIEQKTDIPTNPETIPDTRILEDNELKKFEEIRNKAGDTIERIDSIGNQQKIRKVFKLFDDFLLLKKIVAQKFNIQIMTNAWLKCYEILSHFKLFQSGSDKKEITAFFNAELPGAFISATNHYVKSVLGGKLNWLASSLYGTNHNLDDTYGLYKKYPKKWLMNATNVTTHNHPAQSYANCTHNGDLTDPSVILKIKHQILGTFKSGVMLYTADGGIDVKEEYSKQEEINAKLIFGELICGLFVLGENGVLIIKHYMFTYPFSLSLISLLSYMFHELYITKPITSRAFNSEIYIVGIGYQPGKLTKKIQEDLLNYLKNFDFNKPIIPINSIDTITLKSIYNAAELMYIDIQSKTINGIIDLYFDKSLDTIYNMSKSRYKKAISTYLSNYPIKKISESNKL